MSIYGKDHFIKFCITTYLANVLRFYTMRVCKHFAALLYSCMHILLIQEIIILVYQYRNHSNKFPVLNFWRGRTLHLYHDSLLWIIIDIEYWNVQ